ncbi:MAG TPA: SDR family oxidoreductase [Gammaproteobacteria bacterium]|nr:SDR family oxidoreductase [Gammaproteobacteria bacterium]
MESILITGGAGYVGNVLVPKLLAKNYKVTVYDILYFGKDTLPLSHPNLKVIKGDIRDIQLFKTIVKDKDIVLHLACISNDPCFELDESLSKSINYDCFEPLVLVSKEAGVKRFIYCSSSSVYGVSDAPEVTEETPLVPLTLYNKYKGLCEPLLFKHMSDDFVCVAIRPATICGYSPRTRLDLSVNILTNHAVNKRHIIVFGGSQKRPNLHIEDMCDLYELLFIIPSEKIQGETFNVGHQNFTIMELAQMVKKVVEQEFQDVTPINISTTASNDNRSYHISSEKIKKVLGFEAKRTVENAVRDLCHAFKAGKLKNSFENNWYYNVKQLQQSEVV